MFLSIHVEFIVNSVRFSLKIKKHRVFDPLYQIRRKYHGYLIHFEFTAIRLENVRSPRWPHVARRALGYGFYDASRSR